MHKHRAWCIGPLAAHLVGWAGMSIELGASMELAALAGGRGLPMWAGIEPVAFDVETGVSTKRRAKSAGSGGGPLKGGSAKASSLAHASSVMTQAAGASSP